MKNKIEYHNPAHEFLGKLAHPPVISVLVVAGLAHPDFLVEIDATAFVPEA